jgi:hypothetical protein
LYRKVQKKAKKTGDELSEVDKRLKEFDAKIQDSDAAKGITDVDMVYVRKEILRITSSIKTATGVHDETFKEA